MDEGQAAGTKSQELDRKELWDQLSRAVTMRGNQDQVLWRIFAAFWAANAILLVALSREGTLPADRPETQAIAGVGLGLSLTWLVVQRRAMGHLAMHERLIERLETRLRVPPDLALSERINRADYDVCMPRWPRGRPLMVLFNVIAALLWAALLCWAGLKP
jgi:hypothetical protein